MKKMGRKGLRTCLSMLLVVTCLLTSFLFLNINSSAQDKVVDTFYVLDEDGNPINVEITQGDLDSDYRSVRSKVLFAGNDNVNSRTNVIGVVRFKSSKSTMKYTEVDTNREGYISHKSAGDAAYIRTESDGSVICKLSGVVMKVPEENIKEIKSFSDCGAKEVSYYSVTDNMYLVHSYTYYNGDTLSMASTRVGYKPGYLQSGLKYYSYDGHYFYSDFSKMIGDYQNNTYANAVNANSPYYNYYQYLSLHTTASFTAEQYNAHVAAKKKESVMLTTGNAFVSVQNKYTVNALLMFGVAINESGWGTSTIAMTKNNLFGLNAVDSNPGEEADVFASVDACIENFAYGWIHKGYLSGGDSRYRGPHFGDKHSGINVKYASDPYWGEKAAARGYYVDTNKEDYGRYTLGIVSKGKINCYKEADVSSKVIYTTDASNGSYIYDFPVTILDTVTGVNGQQFYKVVSDMSLKDDRTARNVEAIYNSNRDYVYVSATDMKVVIDGSSVTIPPSQPGENTPTGKTHTEVLNALSVVNSDNYLTGFTVGSEISTVIAKVHSLDANIQVAVKNAGGTQITSGIAATGMTIAITTNGSTAEYTVVIRGDMNGDGKLSAVDYVKLRNYLDGTSALQGAYLKGADTTGDGKASALDYVRLRNHLDSKSAIAQ